MKPKYAPELEELMRVRDGSIDESVHNIQLSKVQAQDNIRQRLDNMEKNMRPVKVQKPQNRSFFGHLANEIKDIVTEVKAEIDKTPKR